MFKNIKKVIAEKYLSKKYGVEVEVIDIEPSGENIVQGDQLKAILNDILSPKLEPLGLKWNGKYIWYSEFNNSIRKIVKYSLCKGGQGTLYWGVCLDFIPTISGKKLVYNRTVSSLTHHLFEWPDEYWDVMETGRKIHGQGIASHWGVSETKRTVTEMLKREIQKINTWFDKASTLEGMIEIAKDQIASSKGYSCHYPSPEYVLAFLYARKGMLKEAYDVLQKEMEYLEEQNHQEVREKLPAKLEQVYKSQLVDE